MGKEKNNVSMGYLHAVNTEVNKPSMHVIQIQTLQTTALIHPKQMKDKKVDRFLSVRLPLEDEDPEGGKLLGFKTFHLSPFHRFTVTFYL